MRPKRSDQSVAVYAIIAISGAALVGGIVLLALGRDVPAELWALALGGITGGFGWARGGTYYDPTPEVVPAPEVKPSPVVPLSLSAQDDLLTPDRTATPAVYPLAAFAADPAAPDTWTGYGGPGAADEAELAARRNGGTP